MRSYGEEGTLLEPSDRAKNRNDHEVSKNLYESAPDLFIQLGRETDAVIANNRFGYALYGFHKF